MKERAMRLIRDVHVLARTYHWSEPDVLRLGLGRRLAYLGLIEEEIDGSLVAGAQAAASVR